MLRRDPKSIRRELQTRNNNLDELLERQAKFGINTPLEVINQIRDEREVIAALEEELRQNQVANEATADAPLLADRQGRGASIQTLNDGDWHRLLHRIRNGKCTPLIGPGVCAELLPSDQEIAQRWAQEYCYPLDDPANLPRVAQFLAIKHDPLSPAEDLADRWQSDNRRPNFKVPTEPHSFLASLPLPLYITTNYADFMCQAIKHHLRHPRRELCRWNQDLRNLPSVFDRGSTFDLNPDNPVVFHLFGHIETPESLVLTEDNYLDFLINISKEEIIPEHIRGTLGSTSLLFLGFELTDWRFRILLRGLIATLQRNVGRMRVAVQLTPKPPTSARVTANDVCRYFENYLSKDDVRVFWVSSPDFIKELQERWEEFNGR